MQYFAIDESMLFFMFGNNNSLIDSKIESDFIYHNRRQFERVTKARNL